MSAWIASDKHIASVVNYMKWTTEEMQRVADLIKKANIRSVNYRYNEKTKIEPCDMSQAVPLSPQDTIMLTASIDYQSCERKDWTGSKAWGLLNCIGSQAGYDLMRALKLEGQWSL